MGSACCARINTSQVAVFGCCFGSAETTNRGVWLSRIHEKSHPKGACLLSVQNRNHPYRVCLGRLTTKHPRGCCLFNFGQKKNIQRVISYLLSQPTPKGCLFLRDTADPQGCLFDGLVHSNDLLDGVFCYSQLTARYEGCI